MSSTGGAAAPGGEPSPVHVPVLLDRVTELLGPACATEGAVLVDATLGLAGHSLALLAAHPGLRLIGLDRDPEARAEALRRLQAAGVADRATVGKFLPLMAERLARQRLRALAKIEGLHDDGKPTVLFLCTHNAGRSQMALGFFQHLAGDAAVAWSGGSEPAPRSTRSRSRP